MIYFAIGNFLQGYGLRVTNKGCFVGRSDWFGIGSPMINKFEEFDYNAKQKPQTCLPPVKYERNVGLWHLGKYVFKSSDLINCLIYGRNVGQWNFGSRSNQSSLDCLGSLIMVDGCPNGDLGPVCVSWESWRPANKQYYLQNSQEKIE